MRIDHVANPLTREEVDELERAFVDAVEDGFTPAFEQLLIDKFPRLIAAARPPAGEVGELIERLNDPDIAEGSYVIAWSVAQEAAATISSQAVEIERLREAVEAWKATAK